MINLLSDLILLLDRDNIIIDANTAFIEWFDIPKISLVRQRIEQTQVNAYLPEEFYKIIDSAIQGNASQYEISIKKKEIVRYFRTKFIPLVFREGKAGVAIIMEDITRDKMYRLELEENVRERTAELSRTNARLTQKIREHKLTLAALAESELKYRRLFETANEGIWIGDPAFTLLSANQKFAEILGYSSTREVIGKNIRDFVFPEDLPLANQKIAERAMGKYDTYEFQFRRKDGRACQVLLSATPVMNPNGSLNCSFEMLTDISALKTVEKDLERKSQHYELLLQTSTDAIHVMDKEGNLKEWNTSFLKHLGYSASEAAFLNAKDWDVYCYGTKLRKMITTHAFDEEIRFETRHRTKIGSIKDVEVCAIRTLINGKENVYASARDITQRKKTERAIAARTNWTRNIAETVGGVLWEIDENGLYRHCSPAIEGILGYAPEELIGKIHYYDLFPKSEKERLRREVTLLFNSRKPFRAFMNPAVSKNGRVILFESTGVPTFGPDGTFTGYRGVGLVISDISPVPDNKNSKTKKECLQKHTRSKKKDS